MLRMVAMFAFAGTTLSWQVPEDIVIKAVRCQGILSTDPTQDFVNVWTGADQVIDDGSVIAVSDNYFTNARDVPLAKGTMVYFSPYSAGYSCNIYYELAPAGITT